MGFKKDAPVAAAEKANIGEMYRTAENAALVDAVVKAYSPEEKKVRGQVRMHALITGYKVAAQLAPTLANTASGIKDELHKLAAEVAAKIEEYSFL